MVIRSPCRCLRSGLGIDGLSPARLALSISPGRRRPPSRLATSSAIVRTRIRRVVVVFVGVILMQLGGVKRVETMLLMLMQLVYSKCTFNQQ